MRYVFSETPAIPESIPPLTDEEYKRLEKNILENGFDKNFPIMEWHGYIADGHNRYSICQFEFLIFLYILH